MVELRRRQQNYALRRRPGGSRHKAQPGILPGSTHQDRRPSRHRPFDNCELASDRQPLKIAFVQLELLNRSLIGDAEPKIDSTSESDISRR